MPATDDEAAEIKAIRADLDLLTERVDDLYAHASNPENDAPAANDTGARLDDLERAVHGSDWAHEREAKAANAVAARLLADDALPSEPRRG